MSQVLPGLWIGGTKKHTEITPGLDQHPWKIRYVRVVETTPTRFDKNTHYFVCPNYGTPNLSVSAWANEVRARQCDSADLLTTVVTDLGGHGRSGLYCAIIMAHVLGISGQEAIAKLRQMHCEQAVETPEQEAYVVRIAEELKHWKG